MRQTDLRPLQAVIVALQSASGSSRELDYAIDQARFGPPELATTDRFRAAPMTMEEYYAVVPWYTGRDAYALIPLTAHIEADLVEDGIGKKQRWVVNGQVGEHDDRFCALALAGLRSILAEGLT